MNATNLQLQIEAMSVMAYVEGMRAANTAAALRLQYPPYTQEDFEMYAHQLESIMQAVDHN